MNWSVAVKQFMTLLGAGLIIWGIYMPLLGIPIFRDRTFFDVSPTGATILVVLAVVSLILAIIRKFGGLYVTGLLALVLLVYTVGEIQSEKTHVESDIREHVADIPFKGTMQTLVSSTRLRHGFTLMGLGTLLLIAIPLLGPRLTWARREEKQSSTA